MKEKLLALFLALCTAISLLGAIPAAAADDTSALQTVRALGIIQGDASGNLNLDSNVTRAQFAKMIVSASSYKDSISGVGSGYSLFKDVKSSYWASEYIKIAVQEGWMTGYTDGTFRPYSTITLEQACATVLRMLGYTSSALAGSYPSAQLSKASALGLRDQISLSQGGAMTRGDCMYLFYNLLTAQNSSGATYATTLGYTVTNGQVNYASVVEDSLSGPYVCGSSAPALSFTPTAVYRNGVASSLSAITQYDVYYYNANLRTIWIYTDRVAGTISAISPSVTAPTSVTVSGTTYTLGTAAATYKLSALSGAAVGDTVMLLLGMDDSVVDAVTGTAVDQTYYGVVQSYSQSSSSTGSASVQTKVSVACTDGVTHTFTIDGSRTFTAGTLVSAGVTSDGTTVKTLSEHSLSGTVNSTATELGSLSFASDVRILDVSSSGDSVKIAASRLADCTLSSVRYYVLDENGKISDLILDDATGDTWKYGFMISASNNNSADSTTVSGSYTYILNGTTKTLNSSGTAYAVTSGGFAVRYNTDGSIKTIKNISSATITDLGSVYATTNSKKYRLADDVQVYLHSGSSYYATTLSAVNPDDYTLTGWYDSFGCIAGGRIRVIVAESK